MFRFILLFGLISLVSLTSVSLGGIPKLINYQGMLTQTDDIPLEGIYNLTLYKYNFRYEDDAEYVERDTGLYASGVNDMIDEMLWLRPVNYTGWEMVHSWIIFTYNRTFLPDSIQFGMNSVNGSIDWISWRTPILMPITVSSDI